MRSNIINRYYGFTFIELMTAIAVLAVVISIGIPSFQTLISNNRVSSQVNNFVTSLNLARSEAINRGDSVTVAAAGGGWADGWTITAADGTVLRQQEAFKNDSTMTATSGTASIVFNSRGFLDGENLVTFTLCNQDSQYDKQVSVTPGGRVNTVSNHDCGD